jgi:peroxiredoxin
LLLEYSVDNGKNWLPAKKTSGLGSKKATFEFSTDNLAEGDFQVLARAIDTSGNETRTPSFTLVVDILQPFVGGSLISFGPQILSQEDSLKTMVGLKQKITVPAIGGATSVAIVARKDQVETLFKLSPLEESNLWSGEASFAESGSYDLQVVSKDGAKNEVKRSLGVVSVTAPGQIVDEANKTPIPEAKVGLYFLEPESASWVVWDGSGFGVENPQKTNDKGQFSFFVPKGKYYLKIEAKDYLPLTSEIFETETAAPISTGISLSKPMLKIGPLILDWRLFFAEKIEIKSLDSKNLASKDIETILPNFSLDSTSGEKVSSLSFRGKPTLITVLGTWSPPSNEQLPILEQLSQNKDLNIVPLVSLESLGKVQVQKEISGSSLDLLVDPHGEVTQKLQFQTLPTHYLISRNGVIKKVLVGVLSKEDLLSELGSQ